MVNRRTALFNESVSSLREKLRSREISAVELTQMFLEHIQEIDGMVNAVLLVTEEEALAQAEEADDRFRGSDRAPGALTGIPILVKDNIMVRGVESRACSDLLKGFVPPYDATVTARIRNEGMVIIGKANMDEYAMGSSGENSSVSVTKNPWAPECVPGGSSSGSAAAVSAGEVPLALGTDTGGSVRQPAALTGVVGMKPTYGLVSRYGVVAFGSSFDQVGPFARDVRDCADLLDVIAGRDRFDSTSVEAPFKSFGSEIGKDPKGFKIGIPKEYVNMDAEDGVYDTFNEAIDELVGLGCEVEEISLSLTDYVLATYYILAHSEASSNLARYDGIRYGSAGSEGRTANEMSKSARTAFFGSEVQRRIFIGTYSLSASHYDAYYKKATDVRKAILREVESNFEKVDFIVTPTSLSTAFGIGERATNPLAMYRSDQCTVLANLAGVPAVSVPCGLVDDKPVGLQLIGRHLDDARMLGLAYAYQEAADWHTRTPSLGLS